MFSLKGFPVFLNSINLRKPDHLDLFSCILWNINFVSNFDIALNHELLCDCPKQILLKTELCKYWSICDKELLYSINDFNNKFLTMWSVMILSCFAYTEIIYFYLLKGWYQNSDHVVLAP